MNESYFDIKKRINPVVIPAITRSGMNTAQAIEYVCELLGCLVIEAVGESTTYIGESFGTKYRITVEVEEDEQ